MKTLGDLTAERVDQAGPDMAHGNFVYVDIGSIDNGAKRIASAKTMSVTEAPSRARQRLAAGDVLVSMTRPNLNAVALVPPALDGAVGSTGFHVLRAGDEVLPEWLYYCVQARTFVEAMCSVVQGALYPAVRPRDIRGFTVDVPPLAAQGEIVAEIERQFSRLDEAVASLQRVKAHLGHFRRAVLASGLDGSMTSADAHPVSEAKLLEVLVERQRKVNKLGGTTISPGSNRAGPLPALPPGWQRVPLGLLGKDPLCAVQTGPFGAQLHNTDFREAGVPVIAVGNLTGTGFRKENLYFVDEIKAAQLSRYDVWAGDLLFARSGATLGKVCVAPSEVADWRMTGHILRARLDTAVILPEIAMYALAAVPAVRSQVFGNIRGVTRPGFNTSLLESIYLPVPPLQEQHRIVAEVDRRLSIARGVEAQVDANLKRAQALRRAVLAKAFGTAAPAGG